MIGGKECVGRLEDRRGEARGMGVASWSWGEMEKGGSSPAVIHISP